MGVWVFHGSHVKFLFIYVVLTLGCLLVPVYPLQMIKSHIGFEIKVLSN